MGATSKVRLLILHVLVMSLLISLGARLWYLQVMSGGSYAKVAADNRQREVVVPAVRGEILDSVGRPLVDNRSALVVSVDPTTLDAQPDGGTAVLKRLAKTLGTSYDSLRKQIRPCARGVTRPCWQGSPYQPIPVDTHVGSRTALQILERKEEFPGISAQVQAVRRYPSPDGMNAAQVLGYLQPVTQEELDKRKGLQKRYSGVDEVGRDGLEETYDQDLRGVPGVRRMTVDSQGQVTGTPSEQASKPGDYLVTSIDAKVQAAAEKAIKESVDKARAGGNPAKSAAAVVLDTRTGHVISLASYPSYDPSIWTGGISQKDYDRLLSAKGGQPLISRATEGQFAPGSTFKISSLDAAIKDGYDLHGTYDCPGSFQVGNRAFKNFEGEAPGAMNLHRALVVSCDTIFYRFAYEQWQRDGGTDPKKHPKDPMVNMARSFGFGKQTGIDLPNEASGRIPDRKWKYDYWKATKTEDCKRAKTGYPDVEKTDPSRAAYLKALASENCTGGYVWRPGDAANFAIGQGDVLVTPLQLANAYASLADGGTIRAPRVAKALVRPDGTLVRNITAPKIGKLPDPHGVLAYERSALADVTRSGTASGAFGGFPLNQIPVAGKTGTAEVYGKKDNSWFASFAPANNPQFAVVAMVSDSGQGAEYAAPAVRKIYDAIYGVTSGGKIDKKKAAFPDGSPPKKLPVIDKSGTISAPSGFSAAALPLGSAGGSGDTPLADARQIGAVYQGRRP